MLMMIQFSVFSVSVSSLCDENDENEYGTKI